MTDIFPKTIIFKRTKQETDFNLNDYQYKNPSLKKNILF